MTVAKLARIREVAAVFLKTPNQKQLAVELGVAQSYLSRLMSEATEDLRNGVPPRRYPNIEHAENQKAVSLGVNNRRKNVSRKRRRNLSEAELNAFISQMRDPSCAT